MAADAPDPADIGSRLDAAAARLRASAADAAPGPDPIADALAALESARAEVQAARTRLAAVAPERREPA
ncbi:MAG: hypothetical protein U0R70_10105 [Solirubrobacteraceae bacterium]